MKGIDRISSFLAMSCISKVCCCSPNMRLLILGVFGGFVGFWRICGFLGVVRVFEGFGGCEGF